MIIRYVKMLPRDMKRWGPNVNLTLSIFPFTSILYSYAKCRWVWLKSLHHRNNELADRSSNRPLWQRDSLRRQPKIELGAKFKLVRVIWSLVPKVKECCFRRSHFPSLLFKYLHVQTIRHFFRPSLEGFFSTDGCNSFGHSNWKIFSDCDESSFPGTCAFNFWSLLFQFQFSCLSVFSIHISWPSPTSAGD